MPTTIREWQAVSPAGGHVSLTIDFDLDAETGQYSVTLLQTWRTDHSPVADEMAKKLREQFPIPNGWVELTSEQIAQADARESQCEYCDGACASRSDCQFPDVANGR